MDSFVGRCAELKKLQTVLGLRSASFIVMNGRRRVGKSRLIEEFAKPYTFYEFTGLAPRKGMVAQHQRDDFALQFRENFGMPIGSIDNWRDLFTLLANQTQQGRVIILLDEITWMAHGDPDFLGQLKSVWDTHFRKNSELILFLCGSVSSWIEENLLGSTAYMGRPTLHMNLKELPLNDCNQFWTNDSQISDYEKFKLLAVTGGIPRYLELMNPKLTAEENIQNMFFNKDHVLFDEYEYIFKDIYGGRSELYEKIVAQLVSGKATQEQINNSLGYSRGGDLSDYLENLTQGGFVTRDFAWNIKTGKRSNLSYYRLSDNYLRFALKYINQNKDMIEKDRFINRSVRTLPGWDSIMGLQFENLVLNNHKQVIKALDIDEHNIVFDNPYFQNKTARNPGCQIDYMIQTLHDTVYVCEIKFQRKPVGMECVDEMKEKLQRLKVPRNISKRAVLIHVNGVTEFVEDSRFFSKIIAFSDILTS